MKEGRYRAFRRFDFPRMGTSHLHLPTMSWCPPPVLLVDDLPNHIGTVLVPLCSTACVQRCKLWRWQSSQHTKDTTCACIRNPSCPSEIQVGLASDERQEPTNSCQIVATRRNCKLSFHLLRSIPRFAPQNIACRHAHSPSWLHGPGRFLGTVLRIASPLHRAPGMPVCQAHGPMGSFPLASRRNPRQLPSYMSAV